MFEKELGLDNDKTLHLVKYLTRDTLSRTITISSDLFPLQGCNIIDERGPTWPHSG